MIQATKDLPEIRALLDCKAQQAIRESKVRQEQKARREKRGLLAHKVLQEALAQRVMLDLPD